MTTTEFNSISFSDFFWIEFASNRVSFSFKGLPQGVHFTIAWNEAGMYNLHITKNIGDQIDKPKYVIAYLDKALLDEMSLYLPGIVLNSIFQPVSFKRYSRKDRKNIRIVYLDNLEDGHCDKLIKEKITGVWQQVSKIRRKGKRNQLKVIKGFENALKPFANSEQIKGLMFSKMQVLTSRSFKTGSVRGGVLLMGKNSYPFVAINGKCYAAMKKITIYELLISFANPEFAKSLMDYINEALIRISDAQCFADTKPFNRPYQLFIEKAG